MTQDEINERYAYLRITAQCDEHEAADDLLRDGVTSEAIAIAIEAFEAN